MLYPSFTVRFKVFFGDKVIEIPKKIVKSVSSFDFNIYNVFFLMIRLICEAANWTEK